jgi:DNA-binding transcriptional ArsR family regulator
MVAKRNNAVPTDRAGTRLVSPVQAAAETSNLDRVIHERMRLGIVSALAASDTLSFAELKRILGTSDGNLSVHARKLEEVGYITCVKRFEGRVPRTDYKLAPAGKRALSRYLDHMAALVAAMKQV